jgi:hypothetical protein
MWGAVENRRGADLESKNAQKRRTILLPKARQEAKSESPSGVIFKPNQMLDPKQDELNVRFFEKKVEAGIRHNADFGHQ